VRACVSPRHALEADRPRQPRARVARAGHPHRDARRPGAGGGARDGRAGGRRLQQPRSARLEQPGPRRLQRLVRPAERGRPRPSRWATTPAWWRCRAGSDRAAGAAC